MSDISATCVNPDIDAVETGFINWFSSLVGSIPEPSDSKLPALLQAYHVFNESQLKRVVDSPLHPAAGYPPHFQLMFLAIRLTSSTKFWMSENVVATASSAGRGMTLSSTL